MIYQFLLGAHPDTWNCCNFQSTTGWLYTGRSLLWLEISYPVCLQSWSQFRVGSEIFNPVCLQSWSQFREVQRFLIPCMVWIERSVGISIPLCLSIGTQDCCRWSLTQGLQMCMRIDSHVVFFVLDIAQDWQQELSCHNCMQVLLYFPDVKTEANSPQ
jgi:hypothetical protein